MPCRMPRFSLRTLLASVTCLCGLFAWGAAQWNWIAARRSAWGYDGLLMTVSGVRMGSPAIAPWPVRLWGEPAFEWIELHDPKNMSRVHTEIATIRQLFPEAKVLYYDKFGEPHTVVE